MRTLRILNPLCFALVAIFFLNSAIAEEFIDDGKNYYITEKLYTGVRLNPNEAVNSWIMAGTKVKILAKQDNWMKISFSKNNQESIGWVRSYTVVEKQPNFYKTRQLLDEIKTLKKQLASSKNNQVKITKLNKENLSLKKTLEQINKTSVKPVELLAQNKKLQQELNFLKSKNNIIVEKSNDFNYKIQQQWFLIGAAVILLGIFIGRFFRIKGNRSKNWLNNSKF